MFVLYFFCIFTYLVLTIWFKFKYIYKVEKLYIIIMLVVNIPISCFRYILNLAIITINDIFNELHIFLDYQAEITNVCSYKSHQSHYVTNHLWVPEHCPPPERHQDPPALVSTANWPPSQWIGWLLCQWGCCRGHRQDRLCCLTFQSKAQIKVFQQKVVKGLEPWTKMTSSTSPIPTQWNTEEIYIP